MRGKDKDMIERGQLAKCRAECRRLETILDEICEIIEFPGAARRSRTSVEAVRRLKEERNRLKELYESACEISEQRRKEIAYLKEHAPGVPIIG